MTGPDDNTLDPAPDANPVERADVAIAAHAGRLRDEPIVKAAGAASEAADQPPMLVLSAATLALGLALRQERLAEAGARMLAALALATAAKSAIKLMVARTRPGKMLEDGRYEARLLGPNEGPWNSFPSGHTANAVAVARTLARVHPPAAGSAYAAAAAVALIQVPRGAHYPLDVAAGALIGWGAEAAADRAARRLGAALSPP